MAPRASFSSGRRFLRTLALVNLAVFAGVALVCWLGGWRIPTDYAHGLTYAGLAVMAFGGVRYFVAGNVGRPELSGYHRVDLGEHLRHQQRAEAEGDSAFVFMLGMGLVGLVPIVVGQLIKALAG